MQHDGAVVSLVTKGRTIAIIHRGKDISHKMLHRQETFRSTNVQCKAWQKCRESQTPGDIPIGKRHCRTRSRQGPGMLCVLEKLRHAANDHTSLFPRPLPPPPAFWQDFNYEREPNVDERNKLSRDIYRVEDSQLAEAVKLLERRCPDAIVRVRTKIVNKTDVRPRCSCLRLGVAHEFDRFAFFCVLCTRRGLK